MSKKQNTKKEKSINSHDAFFKSTFSYPEIARSYIEHFMDKNLVKNIDLDSLTLENASYVTPELSEYFSDLVWNANYNSENKVRISFLFEHKSYTVPYPHVQLLRYILEHLETQIKAKEKPTVVIPIIIYHGEDEWIVRPFSSYFEGIDTNLERFVPNFEYQLTNLNKYSDEELIKMGIGKLVNVFLAMIHIRDMEYIRKNFNTLFIYAETYLPQNENFLQTLFVYLFKNSEISGDELNNIVTSVHENLKNFTMSTYDMLIQKGIEQGIEQGIEKGKYQFALNLITQFPDWDDEKIASLVAINVETVQSIRKNIIDKN